MTGIIEQQLVALPQPEEDVIFALTARYQSALKEFQSGALSVQPINLGIGKFADENGKTPMLGSIRSALQNQLSQRCNDAPTGGYQPILGGVPFRRKIEELILGEELVEKARKSGTVESCQAIGGTGANYTQGCFLHALGVKKILLSNPTWGNHKKIFPFAGVATEMYPYFDSLSGEIQFNEMKTIFSALEKGVAVSFHGCCHNPSGADLSQEQWQELALILKERESVAVFDVAYAGFGDGFEEDLYSVRHFVEVGVPTLVAFSFSKIASLYEERMGACLVVFPEGVREQAKVGGILESISRPSISNPPALVSRAVTEVLSDATLRTQWMEELAGIAAQMATGRELLAAALTEHGVADGGILGRKGMFAMLPLTKEHVARLEHEEQLYMMASGRINVAAVKRGNVSAIAERIARVVGRS